MGLNLQAMEKITADVQMKDLKWVEVGEGSYFKVLTVHEPTNTVAFSYKMDGGAPDFPSHFHICRAMAWTVRGWYGYRESKNPVKSYLNVGFPDMAPSAWTIWVEELDQSMKSLTVKSPILSEFGSGSE